MKIRRNTLAFTFLAWSSFVLSVGFMFVGLYNMDAPLVEKGWGLCLFSDYEFICATKDYTR